MAEKKTWKNLENPKDTMLRVRVDKITLEKLDKTAEGLNSNRSDVIRQGIDLMEKKLHKK